MCILYSSLLDSSSPQTCYLSRSETLDIHTCAVRSRLLQASRSFPTRSYSKQTYLLLSKTSKSSYDILRNLTNVGAIVYVMQQRCNTCHNSNILLISRIQWKLLRGQVGWFYTTFPCYHITDEPTLLFYSQLKTHIFHKSDRRLSSSPALPPPTINQDCFFWATWFLFLVLFLIFSSHAVH